jgi:MYXO-CTERM domain-containing protein
MPPRIRLLATGAAIAAAAIAAHAPALPGGFVFDDHYLVLGGEAPIQGSLADAWLRTDAPDYLPVTWTVLWIAWRLWGADPLGYHLLGLLLHAATALLAWRALRGLALPGAGLAAALFAVHPVAVESVAWISELKNTVSGALFFGAALAWLRFDGSRDRRTLLAAAALLAAAVLAKPSAVVLPAALLAVPLLRRGRITRRDLLALAPLLAVALVGGLLAVWFQHRHAMEGMALRPRGPAERIGGAAWALGSYLLDAFAPVRLAFLPPEWPVGPSSAWFYAPLALLVAAAIALWRRRAAWGGPVGIALGYHLAVVLPVLGLVDMAWLAFAPVSNHLQYLALVGPAALAAAALDRLRRRHAGAAAALAAALLLALAGLAFRRALAFESDATLWRAAVRDAPGSAMARYQLAMQLLREGDQPGAVRELEAMASVARDPALRHRARCLFALFTQRYAQAAAEAVEAARLWPDPWFGGEVARQLLRAGREVEAAAVLQASKPGAAAVEPR